MGRERQISRSPPHRRRYSPSPSEARSGRRSRRERSRSPYSHSRRQRRSLSSRHRSRSPTPRRRKSRSPTPKLNKRQRKRSTSSSPPIASPHTGTKEMKDAREKLKNEGEDNKRRQQELELKLIEEETAKRVEEEIRKKVEENLNRPEIKLEIEKLLEEGRKKLVAEVAAQLEKEKESAVIEALKREAKTLHDGNEMLRWGGSGSELTWIEQESAHFEQLNLFITKLKINNLVSSYYKVRDVSLLIKVLNLDVKATSYIKF